MAYAQALVKLVAAALLVSIGTASAQESGPIRIGIDVPMTGFFADSIRPIINSNEMWLKEINERGGLLGRKVEITTVDNKSNPETGVAIYQKMLQEKYDFIFEDGGSLLVQRESTVAEQNKRLMLAPAGFARALYRRGYKYLFFTGNSLSDDSNVGLANLVRSMSPEKRPKSIAYATLENIAFTAVTRGFQEHSQDLRLHTDLDITYPANLNDATPIVENIKQKNPDIVFQTGLSNDTLLFVRAAKQQGLNPKILAIGYVAGALPNYLDAVGEAGDLTIYGTGWEPEVKNNTNPAFVAAYEKRYKARPTYNAAHSYARWQILEAAVNATRSLDSTVLRDFISKTTFDTVVGPIKYNNVGYSEPQDTLVVQFQKGKRVIVWPKNQAGGELIIRQ